MAQRDSSASYTYVTDDSEYSDSEMRSSSSATSPPRADRRKARKEDPNKKPDASKRGREMPLGDAKGGLSVVRNTKGIAKGVDLKKKKESSEQDRDARGSSRHGMYLEHVPPPRRGPSAHATERGRKYTHNGQPSGSGGQKEAGRRDMSCDAENTLEQKRRKACHQSADHERSNKKQSSQKIIDVKQRDERHDNGDISNLVRYFVSAWFPPQAYHLLCKAADSEVPSGPKEMIKSVESFAQAFLYRNGDLHSEMNTGLKNSLALLARIREKYASPTEDLTEEDTTKCIWEFCEKYILSPCHQDLELERQKTICNLAMKNELGSERRLRSVVQLSLPVFTQIHTRRQLLDALVKYIATVEEHAATKQQEMNSRREEVQFIALRTGTTQKPSKKAEWRGEWREAWRGEQREPSWRCETGETTWSKQTKEAKEPAWRRDSNEQRWCSEPKEQNAYHWKNNEWKYAWQGKKKWESRSWRYDKTKSAGNQEKRERTAAPPTARDAIAGFTEDEKEPERRIM